MFSQEVTGAEQLKKPHGYAPDLTEIGLTLELGTQKVDNAGKECERWWHEAVIV